MVFEEKIIVQTHYGDIELPRKKFRGILCLPEYFWKNTGSEFKIYYYYGNFNIYKKQIKLFTKDNFSVYMQID